jgi:hypothetical protein
MSASGDRIRRAAESLSAALAGIDGLPTHTDPALPITPPCTVLGPPQVRWETVNSAPSSARFIVYIVENMSAGAIERLWDLPEPVADAIHNHTDGVVIDGFPQVFLAGSTQLPCYELAVEVALT